MRLLAIDTTTPRGSVAVVSSDGVEAEARVQASEGHSRWLLPAVDALLRGLGVEPGSLDAFAVTVGPGSFTGLRVGLSSVQGLALASGKRCIGMSSLEVLALGATGEAETVVPLVDAFRSEVFWAVYGREGEALVPPRVGPLEEALERAPAGCAFVGEPAERHRTAIEGRVPGAQFPAVDLYLAVELGRAALRRGLTGGLDAALLRPLYLRGADIRLPRSDRG